jgi:UrcA family protein
MNNPLKTLAKTAIHTLAALGLAGVAVSPALAGNAERMTITVSTADLDLATPAGQKTLDRRVEKAVRGVCRTTSLATGSRILSHEAQACLVKSRADARQQVAVLVANEQRGG